MKDTDRDEKQNHSLRGFKRCVKHALNAKRHKEALHFAGDDEGDSNFSCRWCRPPHELPKKTTTADGRPVMSYPRGPRGGEIRDFPDSDRGDRLIHWIEVFDRVDGDMFYTADSLIPLVHMCATLKKKAKTMYACAQRLTSYRKVNGFVFFDRDDFFALDLPVLNRRIALARAEAEEDRELRKTDGANLRSGRHVVGCSRDHRGCCDHRLVARERARVTKSILDDLGK